MRYLFFFVFSLISLSDTFSQCNFQFVSRYDYPPFNSPLTNQIDKLGRPYLYVASNEFGLRIFKTNTGTPVLNNTLDTNDLFMRVMSVAQYDTLLYVAVGSHFDTATDDSPGMVIVSVSDPENPVILGNWIHSSPGMGTGMIVVEGDYAYVGGMTLGLFILNIADPNNIFLEGSFLPTIDFPIINPPSTQYGMFNARGMEVKNKIVYLCYDRGGLRIINCTNPNAPFESGRYVNPLVAGNVPRAYNNIVLNDTVAYAAVDYCGVEILDIRDTSNIQLLDHYNPHNCPVGFWWTSPIHANEMHLVSDCNKLMVAGGKSEFNVLDISDPYNVNYCGGFGSLADTSGTWGMSFRNDTIYLSYVFSFNIAIISPFWAEDPGIRMIRWTDHCVSTAEEIISENKYFKIYPNPLSKEAHLILEADKLFSGNTVKIYDLTGKCIYTSIVGNDGKLILDPLNFPESIYNVILHHEENVYSEKLMIVR
jgi:hypothetical protein